MGTLFKITTWGESHGKGVGVVIDGCPAGLSLCEADIQKFLDRRKPGQSRYATPRKEDDAVEILSGVFEGKTTGTPIALLVPNTSQRSSDYSQIANCYRPGHADYTYDTKYGFRDYRGGGRSSGRETIGRVAAGAIASKILNEMGIHILAYTRSIGPVTISMDQFNEEAVRNTATCMPDYSADEQALTYLQECMHRQDSAGGVIECQVTGVPAGIGDGIAVSKSCGSENNDHFEIRDGRIVKKTNHAGGILGGISDGSTIVLRAHVKPTPSIFSEQDTVNNQREEIKIAIRGRHDPVIVPRAVVVVESMIAITLLDEMMKNMSSRLNDLKTYYAILKDESC